MDRYEPDPADPRAPDLETWERLSSDERRRLIRALPSELQAGPTEGDAHRIPREHVLQTLEGFVRRNRRNDYVSSGLFVYYPGERVFAPDLLVVSDVEPRVRQKWVVAREGKGLDLALEITVEASRARDLDDNLSLYARLAIPEYFVFDVEERRLFGFRLSGEHRRGYEPMIPNEDRWHSGVLGLDLAVEGDGLRFYAGSAPILAPDELLARADVLVEDLEQRLDDAERRAVDEARHSAEEARRAGREAARADAAEARVAELERGRR